MTLLDWGPDEDLTVERTRRNMITSRGRIGGIEPTIRTTHFSVLEGIIGKSVVIFEEK
jgi:hypothetical protein